MLKRGLPSCGYPISRARRSLGTRRPDHQRVRQTGYYPPSTRIMAKDVNLYIQGTTIERESQDLYQLRRFQPNKVH